VGRGREVILEGEKRPGEERPDGGVNNTDVGNASAPASDIGAARRRWVLDERRRRCKAEVERDAEFLGAAAPQGGKRQGGQRGPRGSCGDGRGEASEGRVPMDDPA